jgi:hypothetical protein
MKNRLLTGWNFSRILYLGMGTFIIVQSIISKQWSGVALGAFMATMGLFALGCASGACFGGISSTKPIQKTNEISPIDFEEIK